MKRGKVYVVSGFSGSGKTVLVDYILKHRENTVRAISFTTRPQRPGEVDGRDYFFIGKKAFLKKVEEGEFLEFSEVYGHLYGTGIDSFRPAGEGKDVIKIIDVQGAMKLKRAGIKGVYIFLKVSKALLRKRLKGRDEAEIELRLRGADNELALAKNFDYVISTPGGEDAIPRNAEKVMGVMV